MPGRNAKNIIGQDFYYLTVLEKDNPPAKQNILWKCKCRCGTIIIVQHKHILKGVVRSCEKCNIKSRKKYKGKMSGNWRGYGDISGQYWARIKCGAKHRNIDFNLRIEDAWQKFIDQNGRCALTGIYIKLMESDRVDSLEITASLDRIDSSRGYTNDNVQWIHKTLNYIKGKQSDREFIEWCKIIAKEN